MKCKKAIVKLAIGSAVWGILACLPLLANSGKLSTDLPTTGTVKVIVQFKVVPNYGHLKKLLDLGGKAAKQFKSVNGFVVTLPVEAFNALAADPDVLYISRDRPLGSKMDVANPTTGANIARQYGFDGSGVGVAIIDSGIYQHPDFVTNGASRIVYSESFVPNDPSTGDGYGHGTHVAGIVGGNAAMSSGLNARRTFMGIAPQANLINLRVLDSTGRGSDSGVIQAIDRAIALKSQYNIRVINLSVGHQVFESFTKDPICQAVEQAWRAGIVVVVAAGNQGRDNSMHTHGFATINSPGNSPFVITVGAMKDMQTLTRADDVIASYSSKGPSLVDHVVKPDLVAPGNGIISALSPGNTLVTMAPADYVQPNYYLFNSLGQTSSYMRLSGTSMASPMVAGAAALLIQKDPTLSPDTIKARLMKTASKAVPLTTSWTDSKSLFTYLNQSDIFTVGAGYMDIWAAISSTDTIPAGTLALSPDVVRNSLTGLVSVDNGALLYGNTPVWESSPVWARSVVWGSNVLLTGSTVVWGSSVVWGSLDGTVDTLLGNGFIWGTSVVWGSIDDLLDALSGDSEEG
jgi:serine protease AprX